MKDDILSREYAEQIARTHHRLEMDGWRHRPQLGLAAPLSFLAAALIAIAALLFTFPVLLGLAVKEWWRDRHLSE